MKFLILHLSDFHFKGDRNFSEEKIKSIVKPFNKYNSTENIIITHSGDLAFSGKTKEYDFFDDFVKKLDDIIRKDIDNVKNVYGPYFVPGNHDVDFQGTPKTRKPIVNEIQSTSDEKPLFNEYISKMSSFFKYAKKYDLFNTDSLIDIHYPRLGSQQLALVLMNSAIYSTFKDSDDDQGLHLILPDSIKKIENAITNSNLTILLSHHSIDWFEQASKSKLIKAIDKNGVIILVGHEHFDRSAAFQKAIISCGGSLDEKKTEDFHIISVDTDHQVYESNSYRWNNETRHYYEIHTSQYKRNIRTRSTYNLIPSKEYIAKLKEDNQRNPSRNFDDYFVFPLLEGTDELNQKDKYIVESLSEFDKMLNDTKIVSITGEQLYGKTTLLKYIFLQKIPAKLPLFFDMQDVINQSPSEIVKKAFEEQYSTNPAKFDKFNQENVSRKLALIDNVDLIKKTRQKELFIEYLYEHFSNIIYTSEISSEIPDVRSRVENEIEFNQNFRKFTIRPFFKDKRRELIGKFTKDNYLQSNISERINNYIGSQLDIFNLSPDFILSYIELINDDIIFDNTDNKNIFSSVFEAKITCILKEYFEQDLEEARNILRNLAYNIHINKEYPFKHQRLIQAVTDYNENYGMDVDIQNFMSKIIESKLIKKVRKNEYRFNSNNHLAYFIAEDIINKVNNFDDYEELNNILKNVHININSSILLFISLLSRNTKIVKYLVQEAQNYLTDWTVLNLQDSSDEGYIPFIMNRSIKDKQKAPTNDDKQRIEKAETEMEKDKTDKIETLSIYDSTEEYDHTFSEIKRGIKYLEIVSKALVNFNHNLIVPKTVKNTTITKPEVVSSIYQFADKISYKILKIIEEDFDELLNDLYIMLNKERATKNKITKKKIESILSIISLNTILKVYKISAQNCSSQKTLKPLKKYSPDGLTTQFHYLEILSQSGDTKRFKNEVDKIYNSLGNYNLKYMVKRLVWNHLLSNYTKSRNNEHLKDLRVDYFSENKSLIKNEATSHKEK